MSNPTMQHRHFKLIAEALATLTHPHHLTRREIAEHFARKLASTNPNFDAGRFIAAAQGEPINGRDK